MFRKKLSETTKTKQKKECRYCLKEGKNYYRVIFENEGVILHFCSRDCVDKEKEINLLKRKVSTLEYRKFNFQLKILNENGKIIK